MENDIVSHVRERQDKRRARGRKYYAEHPEKRQRDLSARRKTRLWAFFRLTPEEYDKILAFQGGTCAVCGSLPGSKRLSVDHRHSDGRIRGLLCWHCNYAIGVAKDDAENLRRMAMYLDSPTAPQALGAERFGVVGKAKYKKTMTYGGPK